MFLIRTLCFNAARKGVSCGASLRPILAAHDISLIAMSEADIPVSARARFILDWKRNGWFVAVSEPERDVCKVALICKFPFKQVQLCSQDGLSRHAAARLDLQSEFGVEPVLFAAVYFQCGAPSIAQAQAQDVLSTPMFLDAGASSLATLT